MTILPSNGIIEAWLRHCTQKHDLSDVPLVLGDSVGLFFVVAEDDLALDLVHVEPLFIYMDDVRHVDERAPVVVDVREAVAQTFLLVSFI